MPRFFINREQVQGNKIYITGSDVNHIKNVLRYRVGGILSICDDVQNEYTSEIELISNERIVLRILGMETEKTNMNDNTHFTLFQSLIKSDKMDWVVQKSVELGINTIVPIITDRTIIRLDEKTAEKKVIRWQKIVEGAAKQSGRNSIPDIKPPEKFENIFKYNKKFDKIILPYENEETNTIKVLFNKFKNENIRKVGIIIGPEGGFAEQEVQVARQAGCEVISLGSNILRSETAALFSLSILLYELGENR